jgi:Protein of unknown function (DUF3800)
MPKYFLYIDESKDFKNHTLYLGGLISRLTLSWFEKICKQIVGQSFPGELKSTQDYHRDFFHDLIQQKNSFLEPFVQKIISRGDLDYLDNIIVLLEAFLQQKDDISEITIYADFTRLSDDMRKTEKAFTKKLSHHFWIPIEIFFKNSRLYRCIQLADLAVGCFRKQKIIPAVDVSQSESKTSLHTTISGTTGTV